MKTLHMAAYLLVWIGAINWGLWGLFNYNLVQSLLGSMPSLVKWVYVLVGVAGVYTIYSHLILKDCKVCSGK